MRKRSVAFKISLEAYFNSLKVGYQLITFSYHGTVRWRLSNPVIQVEDTKMRVFGLLMQLEFAGHTMTKREPCMCTGWEEIPCSEAELSWMIPAVVQCWVCRLPSSERHWHSNLIRMARPHRAQCHALDRSHCSGEDALLQEGTALRPSSERHLTCLAKNMTKPERTKKPVSNSPKESKYFLAGGILGSLQYMTQRAVYILK